MTKQKITSLDSLVEHAFGLATAEDGGADLVADLLDIADDLAKSERFALLVAIANAGDFMRRLKKGSEGRLSYARAVAEEAGALCISEAGE